MMAQRYAGAEPKCKQQVFSGLDFRTVGNSPNADLDPTDARASGLLSYRETRRIF